MSHWPEIVALAQRHYAQALAMAQGDPSAPAGAEKAKTGTGEQSQGERSASASTRGVHGSILGLGGRRPYTDKTLALSARSVTSLGARRLDQPAALTL